MSLTRVHNFAISLDGFGTGEGQSADAHFGHAGERLHEWMFATRSWHTMVGKPGGSGGVDDAFAQLFAPGSAPRSWGPGSSAPRMARGPGLEGRVGSQPAVPHADVRPDPVHAPSIEMEGGTTFHFLDVSPAEALEPARKAANGQDVRIGGGPTVMGEFLAAGLVDQHARRGGPDPARPGRTPLGRTRGPREGLRDRGNLVAQRRNPRDVQPCGRLNHLGREPVGAGRAKPAPIEGRASG